MPEFIETLQTYIDFTCDKDVLFVDIELPDPADFSGYRALANASGQTIFTKGDQLRIISVGYILPGSFVEYTDSGNAPTTFDGAPVMGLIMRNVTSADIIFPYELSGNITEDQVVGLREFNKSIFFVPYSGEYFFNALINPNKNAQFQSLTLENFELNAWLFQLRISMLNLPDTYDDLEQKIRLFVKVAHSLPLITGS